MSEQHQDDDPRLDQRLAELYHSGDREEPPAELDRRILAAAHASGSRRRRRWPMAGLATAAGAVLAVAILLQPMLDSPNLDPGSAAERRSIDAPAAQKPAAPSRRSQAAEERRNAPVEEIVVISARLQSESAAEAAAERGEPAAEAPPADAAAPSYTAPGCAEPYPLPPGAVIRSVPGGLEVTAGDTTFTLRCRAGAWQRKPASRRDR